VLQRPRRPTSAWMPIRAWCTRCEARRATLRTWRKPTACCTAGKRMPLAIRATRESANVRMRKTASYGMYAGPAARPHRRVGAFPPGHRPRSGMPLKGVRSSHGQQPCLELVLHPGLASLVTAKLALQWLPEQIAGRLKQTYPGDLTLQVSQEAIYRSLFIQTRGALKKELLEHLRRTRGMRRSRRHTQKTSLHGQIPDTVSISERPTMVDGTGRARALGR